MTTPEKYDLLVIGAGPAGSAAIEVATKQRAKIALVEQDKLGGTCLNYGCDPTKTLLYVAHLLYEAQHAATYGLDIPTARPDWSGVMAYVQRTLNKIRGGTVEEAQAKMRERGIDLYMSQASFISPHEIAVSDQTLWADQILIAAGTETSVPSVEGLTEVGFITNVEAVSLPKLPQRLAIVGGGPLGLEFAQIFSRFGVTVTVLESLPDILSTEDREVADKLCELLAEEGVSFRTGVKLQQAQSQNGAKRLILQDADEQKEELVVDEILLAAGRRPALAPLNLKAAGVETNEQGIVVDKTLRTNVPHIWAAGDVIGGYKFTSVASAQGVRVARNAFAEKPEPFDDSLIPWAVYTHPGLAHIGKTEKQLQEAGTNYEVVQTSLEEVARAVAMNKSTGLVKLLVAEDGQILGGHILAPHAGDLIALIVLAMKYGLTADSVGSTILPYPTLVEAITKTMRKV